VKTVLITEPAVAPVSVDALRFHCVIPHSEDDEYLASLSLAAVSHIESVLSRKLINQTWRVYFDDWPQDAEIILPFGNCQSVTSIVYKDSITGAENTWDPANYIVDTAAVPGRVVIAYGQSWPDASLYNVNPVSVTFVTGYGAAPADIPDAMLHAVKLLVAHWYENREIVNVGQTVTNVPKTVDALLWPHRLFGF